MLAPETTQDRTARGLFLSLDGPDGGGKTTQAALLAAWLRARGLDVVTCRDPGGTSLGDRLRAILLDRETTHLSLRAEMLLYMASRAQLVEEVVWPALAEGRVVVSDRYLLAISREESLSERGILCHNSTDNDACNTYPQQPLNDLRAPGSAAELNR